MDTPDDIAGIILAGGRATRMGGGDKGMLPLGTQPILAHVIARARPQVTALALNANGDPARFAAFGLPVLADPIPGFPGPLAGILAGLDWAAQQGHARLLTVAADTPFLPRDLVARLGAGFRLAASPDAEGRVRLHPTIGIWPVALATELRAAVQRGDRKVGLWALQAGATRCVFHDTPDPFFNINTPQDLACATARLT